MLPSPPRADVSRAWTWTRYVFLTVGRIGSASRDVTQRVEYVDERDKVGMGARRMLPVTSSCLRYQILTCNVVSTAGRLPARVPRDAA